MRWTVKSNGADGWSVADDEGTTLFTVAIHDEDGEQVRTRDEAERIARMAAAAPEQHAALHCLVNVAHGASMGYPDVTPELLDAASERGSQALRSARGLPPREERLLAGERVARAQQRDAAAAGRAA